MSISQQYQTIFIHIPKTAGESITSVFAQHEKLSNIVGKHSTAIEVRNIIGQELFSTYFSFSFIRNPWDQVVSFYNHLRKPLYLPAYENKCLHPVNACKAALNSSFKEWVIEVYQNKQVQDEMFREKFPIDHFKPQYKWICDEEDRIIIDYVGKYENLEKDLEAIGSIIHFDFKHISHQNKSLRCSYTDYYDTETRDIIAKHFERDIELFNYKL